MVRPPGSRHDPPGRTAPAPADAVANELGALQGVHKVLGSSGPIQFTANYQTSHTGSNPVDKALPILRLQPDGTPRVIAMKWPAHAAPVGLPHVDRPLSLRRAQCVQRRGPGHMPSAVPERAPGVDAWRYRYLPIRVAGAASLAAACPLLRTLACSWLACRTRPLPP